MYQVGDKIVLDDPDALACAIAVAKHNCRVTLENQRERVEHFKRRGAELGLEPRSFLIVLLNVDDPNGGALASALMPNNEENWAAMRARGETPFARGIVMRESFEKVLQKYEPEAAAWLARIDCAVVVMDFNVVEVFEV